MEDIWSHVALFIPKGSWKSYIFTCKLFASFNSSEQVKKRANHLMTWVKLNPKLPWDFKYEEWGHKYDLPKYYDIEVVKLLGKWDWFHVSSHPSIKREDIFDNLNLPWDGLLQNPNLSLEDMKALDLDLDYTIFNNSGIPLEDLLKMPNVDWGSLSSHEGVTMAFVLDNLDKHFDWVNLSMNTSITIQDIIDHPDMPWDYLEMRDDFTSREYLKIQKGFIYELNKVYIEDILANPELPWTFHNLQHCNFALLDLQKVSIASSITIEDLVKIEGWDWDFVNRNTRIPLSDILKHPNLPWDFDNLMISSHISDIEILEHPELFKNIEPLVDKPSSVYAYLDKKPCHEDLAWLKFW